MVQHVEGTSNVNNFGAYAIVLDAAIAKSLGTAYEMILKRFQALSKNIEFVCWLNNEVTNIPHCV